MGCARAKCALILTDRPQLEERDMSDATGDRVEENNDVFTDPAIDKQTITNDAVAGETVIDTGHYAGPSGSEPLEAEPNLHEEQLDPGSIDLRDEE
jgi:hypothetical protein